MELTADDIKTIREMRRWMQTNGQAGTLRPTYQRKVPRTVAVSQPLKLIKAPANGIPGRVGTLLGFAECDVWKESLTTEQIEDSTKNITVYNWTTSAVCKNGDRFGIAGWCNGAWYIISEDCNDEGSTIQPASTSGTVTTPTDPLQLGSPPILGTGGQFRTVQWYGAGIEGGLE